MEKFYTDLIGKRWQKDAKGPNTFDCYHLVKELQKRRGFYLPEQDVPDGIEMRMKMFEKLSSEYAEPIDKPEPYSIVVFDVGRLGRLHIGVVLEDCRSFIHAAAYIRRVRIDKLSGILFQKRIAGYYRCLKKL